MAANDIVDDVFGPDTDPVARFDLIASAVAEAEVAVRTARDGLPTHTDGHTIWVSENDARNNLRLSREAVLIQALLLRHGALDRARLSRLRRTATAHRYFGYEVRRALALGSPLPLVGSIADILGDPEPASKSTAESLDWARNRTPAAPTPPHWGTLIPKSVRSDVGAEAGDLPTYHAAAEPAENANSKDETAEKDPAGAVREKERTDMFTLVARRIRKSTKGGRQGDGSGTMLDGWSSGAPGALAGMGRIPPPPAPMDSDQSSRGGATIYPEWDDRRVAYRANWCHVRESTVPQRNGLTVPPISPDSQLQRGMVRLARSLAAVNGQHEGDDIDLDAVIDRQVSRRSDHFCDHGAHVARLRVKPELSVMILMDASSSTAIPLSDGRTVFDEQRSTATALIDSMAATGLSTAWWTFRSQGRHAVSIEQVKNFDQPADYDMHARGSPSAQRIHSTRRRSTPRRQGNRRSSGRRPQAPDRAV